MGVGHPSSFVALVVEDGAWRTALLGALPPRVRALHPADVHVTLAFLGGVTPERARAAFDAAAALPLCVSEARLERMVPLGPAERWTALSVLFADAPVLVDAMRDVRRVASTAAGIAEETRAPLSHWLRGDTALRVERRIGAPSIRSALPHVTLARLHAKASPSEREAALRWAGERRPEGVLRLARLALYTGRRTKEAGMPAYEIVLERCLDE